ncbi:MAG: T9SS type A sorting domain-containing protein, partial [Flavobacteriales bacterium]
TSGPNIINAYYNSINMNASSSGATFGTTGIYMNTTLTATLINNLVVNTSTPNGTAYTTALRRSSTALATFGASSDYNDYYVNAAGNRVTFFDGTTAYGTLAAYQAMPGLAPRDANSISVQPLFVSPTNLHLDPTNLAMENTGTVIAINNDFDVQTRDCPEIGADEAWSCVLVILPVKLISLTAECEDEGVVINWVTESEINNDYFTLERSDNGNVFEEIAVIDGAGNSNQWKNYSFTDVSTTSGITYYRLKQTDFNGQVEYFQPVSVNCNQTDIQFGIYPNPSNGNNIQFSITGIESASEVLFIITDISGKTVQGEKFEKSMGQYFFTPTQPFASGIYIVNVYLSNKWIGSEKLVVSR